MTKREAMRAAHAIAYRFIQQALDSGPGDGFSGSPADQMKIEDALDTLAQRHFEHSTLLDEAPARPVRRTVTFTGTALYE